LIPEKRFPHRPEPAESEEQRDAETHLGNAAVAVMKSDRDFEDPQIPSTVDERFERDLETGRGRGEFQEQFARDGEKAAHGIVHTRERIGEGGGVALPHRFAMAATLAASAAPPPIEPGESQVAVTVTTVWALG